MGGKEEVGGGWRGKGGGRGRISGGRERMTWRRGMGRSKKIRKRERRKSAHTHILTHTQTLSFNILIYFRNKKDSEYQADEIM